MLKGLLGGPHYCSILPPRINIVQYISPYNPILLFNIRIGRGLRQVNLSRGTDAACVTIALAPCLKINK
jgi:hypothetical protein